jgi:hypothetical protein
VHARRPFFVLADVAANARRKAQGTSGRVISPLALEAVRRIDALFDLERAINGESAERRWQVRQDASAPLIWVYGVGKDGVAAFTQDGIDNLRQIIADKSRRNCAHPTPPQIAYPAVFTACFA